MNDWLNVLQLATLIGLAVVSTYVGIQRARSKDQDERIEGLRGDRDDLQARVEARDRMIAEEREARLLERSADYAQIARLNEAVEVLKETVTGEVHWTAVEGLLASHHDEAMVRLQRIEAALQRLSEEK